MLTLILLVLLVYPVRCSAASAVAVTERKQRRLIAASRINAHRDRPCRPRFRECLRNSDRDDGLLRRRPAVPLLHRRALAILGAKRRLPAQGAALGDDPGAGALILPPGRWAADQAWAWRSSAREGRSTRCSGIWASRPHRLPRAEQVLGVRRRGFRRMHLYPGSSISTRPPRLRISTPLARGGRGQSGLPGVEEAHRHAPAHPPRRFRGRDNRVHLGAHRTRHAHSCSTTPASCERAGVQQAAEDRSRARSRTLLIIMLTLAVVLYILGKYFLAGKAHAMYPASRAATEAAADRVESRRGVGGVPARHGHGPPPTLHVVMTAAFSEPGLQRYRGDPAAEHDAAQLPAGPGAPRCVHLRSANSLKLLLAAVVMAAVFGFSRRT